MSSSVSCSNLHWNYNAPADLNATHLEVTRKHNLRDYWCNLVFEPLTDSMLRFSYSRNRILDICMTFQEYFERNRSWALLFLFSTLTAEVNEGANAIRTLCARLNRRKNVINRFHSTNRQMITVGTVSSLTCAFHNCHGEQRFLYVASTKVHGTVEIEIMENRRDFTLFFPFGGCGYVQCLSETGSRCKLTWTSLLA